MGLAHDKRCNMEFHSEREVDASRSRFNWKVVEACDGAAAEEWVSWEDLNTEVKEERHKATWRYCTDMEHAWTGLLSLKPGQSWPYHKHTTPEFYYVMKGGLGN